MKQDLRYLRLPGVSVRDPNFYEGADYNDRDRFAQPVKDGKLEPLQFDPGTAMGDEAPTDDYPTGTNPDPFKLGGL
jgi:hypothetical protein